MHQLRREPVNTEKYADALIALADDQGFPFRTTVGVALRSLSLIRQGKGGAQEVAPLQGAIDSLQAVRSLEPALRIQTFLAQACLHLGDLRAALEASREGLRLTRHHAQGEFEALFLRLLGDVLLAGRNGADSEAESFYRESIEVARRQEAKSLELQAALGLARLWSGQGRRREAHDLLAPVYNWFTQGFDTKDLIEAKMLLKELS